MSDSITSTCNPRPHMLGAESPNEDGVAMVEMAVCIPFFVLLLFGLFEIGFMLYQYPIASQAVYEAAHQASKTLPADLSPNQDFHSYVVDTACESLADVSFSRRGYSVVVEGLQLSDAFSLRIRATPVSALAIATGHLNTSGMFSTETVIRLREAPSALVASTTVVNCTTPSGD